MPILVIKPRSSQWYVHSTVFGESFPGYQSGVVPFVTSAVRSQESKSKSGDGDSWSGSITISSTFIKYNNQAAANIYLYLYGHTWGSWYTIDDAYVEGRIAANAYGLYVPYFYNHDYNSIPSNTSFYTADSRTTHNVLIWLTKSGDKPLKNLFPTSLTGNWEYRSIAQGNTLSTLKSNNIIPITISAKLSQSYSGGEGYNKTIDKSFKLNNKTAISYSGKAKGDCEWGIDDSAYFEVTGNSYENGFVLFLPYYYLGSNGTVNFTALQTNSTSNSPGFSKNDVLEWYEKVS